MSLFEDQLHISPTTVAEVGTEDSRIHRLKAPSKQPRHNHSNSFKEEVSNTSSFILFSLPLLAAFMFHLYSWEESGAIIHHHRLGFNIIIIT